MLTVNPGRIEEVFGRLLRAYLENEFPYNQPEAVVPQLPEFLPKSFEWGGREHALFLFALCYWMRGGSQSDDATRSLTKFYNVHHRIFLPEHWEEIDSPTLMRELGNFGLGYNATQVSVGWKENLKRLHELWNSDPRNIFKGISTYEEACERIQNKKGQGFYGFQEKMVSMITYFLMDAKMVDRWHFPIPVDFHVLRTVFSHELVVPTEDEYDGKNGLYRKHILDLVRTISMKYSVGHDADPLDLCSAVWIFSRIMCSQNAMNERRKEGGRQAKKGRQTRILKLSGWTEAQTRRWERTCLTCPVRSTCTWTVPSADYYIRGQVVRGERHQPPPQERLFAMRVPDRLRPRVQRPKERTLLLEEVDPTIQGSLFGRPTGKRRPKE